MPRTRPGSRPSRKEQRKQQRSQKKAKKAEYFSKKKKREGASLSGECLAIVPESRVGKRDDRKLRTTKEEVLGDVIAKYCDVSNAILCSFHSETL